MADVLRGGGQGPGGGEALVVLAGLPAAYGQGLRTALSAAGLGRVVRVEPRAVPGMLTDAPSAVVVVVVPAQAAAQLRRDLPGASRHRTALVHLTPVPTVQGFAEAVRAGALGVLDPRAGLDTAVEVVRSAAAGRVLVPRHVLSGWGAPEGDGAGPAGGAPQVTQEERAWLAFLGRGGTVAALARSAAYSEREVYRLLSKLYERLGAANRTGALLRAAQWGLLGDGPHAPEHGHPRG